MFLILQLQDIQQFYACNYSFTKAHAHVHALEALGFQPGAVVAGVMRTRLMHSMAAGAGTAVPGIDVACFHQCRWHACLLEPGFRQ